MKTILYLTRNGLLEPLGRSQILPYLIFLSKRYKIIIISKEKDHDIKINSNFIKINKVIKDNKIIWLNSKFTYGKILIPYSIFKDFLKSLYVCFKYNVDIIHCRSYLPNFVGLFLKIITKKYLLFDMRGLWPEEIALGLRNGRKSIIYKSLNILERYNLYYSDSIISLTNSAKNYLNKKYDLKEKNIFVIPTCVDTKRFKFCKQSNSKIKKFSCIGTILSDLFLLDWLKRFIYCVNEFDDSAEFEIITRDNRDIINSKFNFPKGLSEKIKIKSSDPEQIPSLIENHSASAMFFTPGISKLGSSPTRLAEILAIGRPVICNSGVGDLNEIIEKNKVGVLVKDEKISSMKESVSQLYELISNPQTPYTCRKLAEEFYSLYSGSEKYHQIYEFMLKRKITK